MPGFDAYPTKGLDGSKFWTRNDGSSQLRKFAKKVCSLYKFEWNKSHGLSHAAGIKKTQKLR